MENTYHFFYYSPEYFEKLWEINIEFTYILKKDIASKEGFERENFEKEERKFLKLNADNPDYRYLICKQKEDLVGFIWYGLSDNNKKVGFIGELYVRAEHQNKGLATKLLHHAIKWLKEKQCTSVELDVAIHNETAIHVYKKLGFVRQPPVYDTFLLDL